ncbi:MAG: hypothetical protein IPK82_43215 [Polyangiaceae bacterium]|nr:hypothetical protein [Polyangiaceae bacterium]
MSNEPHDDPPRSGARRLDVPLRIEALKNRLAGNPEATRVLERATAIEQRVQELTARAREAGSQGSPTLATEVAVLRLELGALLAEALGEEQQAERAQALKSLDPSMRHHLAALLNVPADDRHHALLEVKAAEYLEQARAFDDVAEQFGFNEATRLDIDEPRGALVLTYNGSLLQLSAPGVDGHKLARRHVYESIYGNRSIPSRGTLSLTSAIRVGERVRTNVLNTSPVRRLRIATRPEEWDRDRQALQRITMTFSSRAPGARVAAEGARIPAEGGREKRPEPEAPFRTIWGAKGAWFPTVVVPLVEAEREKRATSEERAELAALVRRLADPSRPAPDATDEAKIMGLVIFLQQSRADAGERAYSFEDLSAFSTDRGERCRIEREVQKPSRSAVLVLDRPGSEPVRFEGGSLGAQQIAVGAPVVVIHPNGAIAAVLGDVAKIESRAGR